MLKELNAFNFCDKMEYNFKYQKGLEKIEQFQKQYTANRFIVDWLKFEEVYQWLHLLGNSLTRIEMESILNTRLILNDKPFSDYIDLLTYSNIIAKMKCSDLAEICPEMIRDFHQNIVLDPMDDFNLFEEKPLQFQADDICLKFNQSSRRISDILDFCVELYQLKLFRLHTKTTVRIVMNYLLLGNGYILCTQNDTTEFTEQFKQSAVDNLIFRYEFFIKSRKGGQVDEIVSKN